MKYIVLSSSSSGNCSYLEVNNKRYLLDAGISLRQVKLRLQEKNIEFDFLDGIFITHEHSDHIQGLASIATKLKATIYTTKKTYKSFNDSIKEKISPIQYKFINVEEEFMVDGMKVHPFKTSHDASESIGFRFCFNEKTLVYLTDTGKFESRLDLVNADSYILECNHEPDMLMMSSRPWILKNRIMSEDGHLSNGDSAVLFSKLMGEKTKSLVLFHLSSECNTKELALLAYESYFARINVSLENVKIIVSDKTEPTDFIEV